MGLWGVWLTKSLAMLLLTKGCKEFSIVYFEVGIMVLAFAGVTTPAPLLITLLPALHHCNLSLGSLPSALLVICDLSRIVLLWLLLSCMM